MGEESGNDNMSFWEHLDVLRGSLIRIVAVTVLCGIVAFFFKEHIFAIILAPKSSDFVTYELFDRLSSWFSDGESQAFSVQLINTGLAAQFAIHMKTSLYVGLLLSSPYVLYLLFRFISPALYENERRYTSRVVFSGYFMFLLGVLLNYFLIFPFTFRFLGTYQVDAGVENLISLQSYMDTLLMMSLMMGILFELPIVCWLLGKLGVLSADFMRHYRRHAIVVILLIAAIITPTSDVFTLSLVALPIWSLYELSILFVPRRKKA